MSSADQKAADAQLESVLDRIDRLEARIAALVVKVQKEHQATERVRHVAIVDGQLFRSLESRLTRLEADLQTPKPSRGATGCGLCGGDGWILDRWGRFDECDCVEPDSPA